jgi:hypothetical protein
MSGKERAEKIRNIEQEYAPRASNASIDIMIGPVKGAREFQFSSPHRNFDTSLNRVMILLPELLSRISPEGEEPYGEGMNIRSTAVSTNATESDSVILADCSAGAVVITLFSATKSGHTLIVIKVDSTTNSVSVVPFGNDTIEGLTSKTLGSQYGKLALLADGVSTWLDIGSGLG